MSMNKKGRKDKITERNSLNHQKNNQKNQQDQISSQKIDKIKKQTKIETKTIVRQRVATENSTYKSPPIKKQEDKFHHNLSLKKINISSIRQYQKQESSKNTANNSQLIQLQKQKSKIEQKIKIIDSQIFKISKNYQQSPSAFKQREKIYQNKEAQENAIKLIKNLQKEKKELQEKKKKKIQKVQEEIKANLKQFQKLKKEKQQFSRQKKRLSIIQKKQEKLINSSIHRQIQKSSNKLIASLLKQTQKVKEKELHDKLVVLEKKDIYQEKKQDIRQSIINLKEISRHQKEYIKQREELMKNKSLLPFDYPIKKYSKNRWATQLEEIQFKQKQEIKLKEIQRQNRIENMKIYGQKMYKVMVIKKRVKTVMQNDRKDTIENKQKLAQSYLKTVQKSPTKLEYTSSNNNLSKEKNNNKQSFNKKYSIQKQKLFQQIREPITSEQQKQKMMSLRKETMKRLKTYACKTPEPQSQKPKYENYLTQFHLKKPEENDIIDKILNDSTLSNQQQNFKILNHAIVLQSKAKMQQQFKTLKKDEVTNLYINSIQAKLILMQKLQTHY